MVKYQDHTTDVWTPQSPEEIRAVRAQLDLLLNDPLFSQSRRYPSLLRRIVEDSLAGHTENLKERILGIEIFKRPADYDTNADAIVRVTAAEIRKRIAQYYHDEKHSSEIRIDLPVGGYVAFFRVAATKPVMPMADVPTVTEPSIAVAKSTTVNVQRVTARPRLQRIAIALTILSVLLVIAFWFRPRDDFETFWRPLIQSPSSTLICVGQLPFEAATFQAPADQLGMALLAQKPVSISDAAVIATFATFLGSKGMKAHIMVSTQTSFSDLRNSPVLLVGGLDNSWTLRLLNGLRYRMKVDPGSPTAQIYNAEKPEQEKWTLNFGSTTKSVNEDYAVIARFSDHETEDTVIIAAGLGENGTAAAADFLTHPSISRRLVMELLATGNQ